MVYGKPGTIVGRPGKKGIIMRVRRRVAGRIGIGMVTI